ncbi:MULTISPECIES: DUF2946 family protein [Rhodopseudomonas]|nr:MULTISPECIES: DUF2946 family protein [Rhodopseudomonas]MDF3808959.1 hypothetical protein [Rhodopseudomonas sp. BAL398]WOK20043.1 hypothetical protein RBJ75_11225 [Rhodopseudomonas sp. BAL398]
MIGSAAAFAAAYALVLNVILSSALLATLSPTALAASHELCFNSANAAALPGDAQKSGKPAAVRCPLCVSNHVAVALPPTIALAFDRVAVAIAPVAAFAAPFVANERPRSHRARGPPRLI